MRRKIHSQSKKFTVLNGVMNLRPKDIKKHAMARLSDSWGQAAIIILVIMVIYIFFMLAEMALYYVLQGAGLAEAADYQLFPRNGWLILISVLRMILGYLVIVPALVGAKWWYLHAVRGEQNGVRSMFVCYLNPHIYFKTVAMKSVVAAINLLAALPVLFCGYLVYRLMRDFLSGENNQTIIVIMAFFASLLMVCLSLLFILFSLKFALVDYLYALNPDLKIRDIIRASERVMKNCRRPLIELIFSFLVWIALCVLIFPVLFVIPYFAMSFTVCINRIIEENKILDRQLQVREPKPAR